VQAERPARRPPVLEEDDEPRRAQPTGTSGKAIWSLVLGLLSFFCVFLTGIPAIILGILGLLDIGRSRGRLRGKGLAITGIVIGSLGIVCTPILTILAVQRVRDAAARMQSSNNLKQIGLALHNYHDANGYLPPASLAQLPPEALRVVPIKPGQLSWRVILLPYLEQESLYRKFRLDEPWDSPNNLPLLKPTPKVYAIPGDDVNAAAGNTFYQAIVGPGAVFDPQHPRCQLREITDGTSNTIIVAEAKQPVPWTKPEDMAFDPNGPSPQLGNTFSGGSQVLFADGSVRVIPRNTPPETIRAMITRSGGEMIQLP
jgi:prepilin-type processing-associated H-X9-DG protein